MNRLHALCCFSVCFSASTGCFADGAWGRLKGDLAIQGDLGMVYDGSHPGVMGAVAIRYLQSAGAYATWMMPVSKDADFERIGSVGVELRPLFLPRLLKDWQGTSPRLNLWIDSFSIRMGTAFAHQGPYAQGPGFETGVGMGIPILPQAQGPWIGVSALWRWSQDAMHTGQNSDFVCTMTLGWQTILYSGLVDWKDTRTP